MYNFEKQLNKYLLIEAYNWKNGEDVINAIKSKQTGVKTNPMYLEADAAILNRDFCEFFSRCKKLNINDTTYGIQFLISHTNPGTLSRAVKNDAIYEFLKSYRKPWVKEMDIYKDFMKLQYDEELWHDFEKEIQKEQANHGKSSKGSGDLKDVKVLYSDDTWWLGIPTSFNGEKAIAFYGKKGEKQTPCEWCTRADVEYYNMYTHNGEDPLYVIRNWKTGDSYQLAFMEDSVEFLDQYDSKSDEISKGDLSKIPDNLLKLIKHFGGRTLLDYKNAPLADNEKLKKNRKYTSNPAKGTADAEYGKPIELENGVVKQEILNFSDEVGKKNAMSAFFDIEGGKYSINKRIVNYSKRAKATKYYMKGHPDAFIVYTATAKGGIDSCGIIQSKEYNEQGEDYTSKVEDIADWDFGRTKNLKRQEVGYDKEKELKSKVQDLNRRIINNEEFFKSITVKTSNLLKSLGYTAISSLGNNPIGSRLKANDKQWDGPSDKLESFRFLPVCIQFKKAEDGSYEWVTFVYNEGRPTGCGDANKAYFGYNSVNNKRKATPEEFKLLRQIGFIIGKEIMKLPEWKELHQNYNNSRDHKNIWSPLYENYFNY